MSLHRISVIDLGTNTFHLLTVEITGLGKWMTIDRERVYVNLASDGIERLSDAVIDRGLSTMMHFAERIRKSDVDEIIAVGTAALRNALNAGEFLDQVHQATGIRVEVISGMREADLIAKGVLAALPGIERPALIMDIGGGSVEMILTHRGNVLFSASYPVGVAVLYTAFHLEEPISEASLDRLDRHLEVTMADLFSVLKRYPDTVLVGASGTFEVVEAILEPQKDPDIPPYSIARPDRFTPIYQEIRALDLEERLSHPNIPDSRARYIVVAVHLIEFMLRKLSRDVFYISAYAMKEGIVVEEMKKQVQPVKPEQPGRS
jgi:exopolyphosphatase/guanosine-5'-triphosphate,3'-diphosphate pyrophosphatase